MENFDDIRPFYDNEIPAAMRRIVCAAEFPCVARYLYPEKNIDDVCKDIISIENIKDFQLRIMQPAARRIIEKTIDALTYSGLENIDPNENYLYVSNHRDIVLDAMLHQKILVDHGHETAEITFGANLMMNQFITDIGRSNKMFRVERPGGSVRDFYNKSVRLSSYIHNTISHRHQSVWIAQRNGRTKDGHDATDQGIVKMFTLAGDPNQTAAVNRLRIVPVSISYEWEPCADLKAVELCRRAENPHYIKQPNEDLTSILTGINQTKGQTHVHIGSPISIPENLNLHNHQLHQHVASLIDRQIWSNYKLYPNNYIAHDILHDNNIHSNMYTPTQYNIFANFINKTFSSEKDTKLKDTLLKIYANPINNIKR